MDLSFVIVSFNTRDVLLDCLASIRRHPPLADYETIVVDNYSQDGTVEAVRRDFPEARLIGNSRNLGFAAANNQGIVASHGRYILLLNSDTLVQDRAISRMVEHMDEHPDAGLLGCQLVNRDGSPQMSAFMALNLFTLFVQALALNKPITRRILNGIARALPSRRVPSGVLQGYAAWFGGRQAVQPAGGYELGGDYFLCGACLLIRRACLQQVGLLDENFFMYAEDADLSVRVRRAGWKLRFCPDALVIHLMGASAGPHYRDTSFEAQRSTLYFFYKQRGRLVFLLAKAFRMLGLLRRLLLGLVLFRSKKELLGTLKVLRSVGRVWSFPPPKENPLMEIALADQRNLEGYLTAPEWPGV
jgi:GT2 family glycosyltransferase